MSSLNNLVTLTPIEPGYAPLRFHLDGDDEPGGGVGGWEDVSRARRRTVQEWHGVDGWTLLVPLYTDGLDVRPGVNASVEPKIAALIRLGMKIPGGMEPPKVELSGPVRVPFPGMRWVIKDIPVWGKQVRRSDEQRVYQEFTVLFKEHVTAEILLGPASAARARS